MISTVIMTLYVVCISPPSPFYDANFTSLAHGSASVFANPAGIGLQSGPEFMGEFHIDTLRAGISLRGLGIGVVKLDSVIHYEVDVGIKLPGAFALGYSYLFKDTSSNTVGVICAPSQTLMLGYKTNLGGERKVMTSGLTIKPYQEFMFLSLDVSYEGVQDTFWYYFGGALRATQKFQAYFCTDVDFNWHAGLDIVLDRIRLAGAYTSAAKKFCAGVVLYAFDM
ncbi:MAG TPA: hypothetical protein VF399_01715 [bacterium]